MSKRRNALVLGIVVVVILIAFVVSGLGGRLEKWLLGLHGVH